MIKACCGAIWSTTTFGRSLNSIPLRELSLRIAKNPSEQRSVQPMIRIIQRSSHDGAEKNVKRLRREAAISPSDFGSN
jgi:hypothetical protein